MRLWPENGPYQAFRTWTSRAENITRINCLVVVAVVVDIAVRVVIAVVRP